MLKPGKGLRRNGGESGGGLQWHEAQRGAIKQGRGVEVLRGLAGTGLLACHVSFGGAADYVWGPR